MSVIDGRTGCWHCGELHTEAGHAECNRKRQQSALAQQSQGQMQASQDWANQALQQMTAQCDQYFGPGGAMQQQMARQMYGIGGVDLEAENAQLRARVAELEVALASKNEDVVELCDKLLPAKLQAQYERAQEDLRRKREECERLEMMCSELRVASESLYREVQECDKLNGEQRRELARLRRERGKR